jgi:putative heme transporter
MTLRGPEEIPQTAPTRKKRVWWKQVLSVAITVAVLALVFGFVFPKLTDYRTVLDYISSISVTQWGLLTLFSIWFLIAYPIVLTQVLPSLRIKEAFVNHMTGTAITNAVPSGGAIALPLNYALYMSWGFTPEAISAGLLGAGVWDWLARIALPVFAVVWVAFLGQAAGWMWVVTVAGAIAVGVMVFGLTKLLGSDKAAMRFASFVERLVARVLGWIGKDDPGMHAAVMRFRMSMKAIVSDNVLGLSLATVGNHLAMTALFAASIYSVGITTHEISVPWVVLAFSLGRFLVMLPVSPGGLGLVDLGWLGLLTLGWQATSGQPVDADAIAAGTLLFRALSFLPPIPIGMVSWIFWRINQSWRNPWQISRRGEHRPTEAATGH